MPHYFCDCCNFITDLKSNYLRHLKTKKHIALLSRNQVTTKSPLDEKMHLNRRMRTNRIPIYVNIVTNNSNTNKECTHIKFYCKKTKMRVLLNM